MKERELPEGWAWKKLGEIGKIYSGSTPSTTDETNFNGDIPWITPADLSSFDEIYISRGKRNLSEKGLQKSSVQMLPKDTVLFSSRAPIGYVAIAANPLTTNQGFKNLVLENNNIIPKFVYYYLKGNKKLAEKYASGTTFLEVSASRFSQIPIPIPPLPTQRKIVAVLERAERLQRLRAEADALTEQLVQSVFLEMFGDPVTNPMGWEVKKLKDISDIVSGVTKGRQFNGKSTVNAPYLRVANVQDGYLNLSEIKEIEVLESDVEKYALLEGDVLLTEGGDRDKLGRGAVWHCEISPCIHQNHIFRVRPNRDLILPDYLSMLIGSNHGKNYFLKSAKQTTGIASINSTQLKNFPVYLPPLFLQACFADIVQKTSILSKKQSHSLNEVTSMFDSLMSRAFTGDLIA